MSQRLGQIYNSPPAGSGGMHGQHGSAAIAAAQFAASALQSQLYVASERSEWGCSNIRSPPLGTFEHPAAKRAVIAFVANSPPPNNKQPLPHHSLLRKIQTDPPLLHPLPPPLLPLLRNEDRKFRES